MRWCKSILHVAFIVGISVVCSVGVMYWLDNDTKKASDQLSREQAIFRDFAARVASFQEFRMAYGPARLPATCVDSHMKAIRDARGDVRLAFNECEPTLVSQIPAVASKLSDDDLLAVFITIVVNRLAPYGDSSESDPERILDEPMLNCAQHSIMVANLISKYVPDVKVLERIGLDGGAIGNHAFVYYESETAKMILDGTTAMIVFADINDVLRGKVVSVYKMYDFFAASDEHLEIFRRNVRGAYRLGAVRPRHIIYRDSML